MRYSRQRENILRQMRQRYDHPTAYMVFEDLKPAMPKLSLGTVYRNLNQLTDAGELKRIDRRAFAARLYDSEMPEVDLLVRTSGEQRISNFLLWQLAYSEIWVTSTLWPDFKRGDLLRAVIDFQKRTRRFGGR